MKRSPAVVALLVLFSVHALSAQSERPVAAVLAFEAKGLSRGDAGLLTDLFSYDLSRDGRFTVEGRRESARIVDSLDMPPMDRNSESYFLYVGDFLYADLVFAGRVEKKAGGLSWRIAAYGLEAKTKLAETEIRAEDFDGLFSACPAALQALLEALPSRFGKSLAVKVENALAPISVKQRVLFAFPEGPLDAEGALARETMACLFSAALASEDMLPLFAEGPWPPGGGPFPAAELAKRYDVHRVFYLHAEGGSPKVAAADPSGRVLASFPPASLPAGNAEAALAALRKELPPLPQETVARELAAIEETNQKLSELLYQRRIASKRFALSFSQKLVKTAGHPAFQPLLDFIGVDADFLWYYDKILGVGAGYGFSAGYPGSLDERIAGHPPIIQHELRLYPVSLRIPGKSGLMAKGFLSLNTHNASKVTFHLAEETSYSDSRQVYYARIGANLGYFINLSESAAITVDFLSLAYCIPISMGPNFQNDRSFCGDLGGLGFMLRF